MAATTLIRSRRYLGAPSTAVYAPSSELLMSPSEFCRWVKVE